MFYIRYKEAIDQGLFKTIDKSTAWALFDWYHILQNILNASYNWMEVEVFGSGQTHYRECPGDPLVTWKHGYHSLFPILMVNLNVQLQLSDRKIMFQCSEEVQGRSLSKILDL